MINYSELKKGDRIIVNDQPHEIIEASPVFKGRGHSTLQGKLKNLINGNIVSKTFHPSDSFEEAEVNKIKAEFIYSHQEKYVFSKKNSPGERFELTKKNIGEISRFLKPKQIVEAIVFENKIINILLPIKDAFKVIEAAPGIKGGRSQAGTKLVTLENSAEIDVPLFIKKGDVVEINLQNGEYVRRIEKD